MTFTKPFCIRKNWNTRSVIFAVCALLTSGCVFKGDAEPDLRILYQQSAQYHMPDRNPIIVIPGILGSKLIDKNSGQIVWGAFEPQSVNPGTPEGARLISLPIENNRPLSELKDNVKSDGVLEKVRVKLLGIPLDIRAYAGILSTLGAGGYRDESLGLNAIDYGDDHFTCFQFDYDWRRDNVENAKRLKSFIDEKRAHIQRIYKERYGIDDAEVKFDVVAHSMGGLVARYFLRYGDADLPDNGEDAKITWAGAEDIERLIMIATPNAGSINAFTQLVDGYDVGRPILPYYQAALLGTFPAVYELLPRTRHHAVIWSGNEFEPIDDLYDPALWEEQKWGLASQKKRDVEFLRSVLPDAADDLERRRIALGLQAVILNRAKAFHQAMDQEAQLPAGVDLFLVAGDAEDTPQTVTVDRKTGKLEITAYGPGDGTVLRSSALLDERVNNEWRPQLVSPIDWTSVMFISANHLGLTQDPAFSDNMLYWLLEEPREHRQVSDSASN